MFVFFIRKVSAEAQHYHSLGRDYDFNTTNFTSCVFLRNVAIVLNYSTVTGRLSFIRAQLHFILTSVSEIIIIMNNNSNKKLTT